MKKLITLLAVLLTLCITARGELITLQPPRLIGSGTESLAITRDGSLLICSTENTAVGVCWLEISRADYAEYIDLGITCLQVRNGSKNTLLSIDPEVLSQADALAAPLGELTAFQLCLLPDGAADVMLVCGEYAVSSLQLTALALIR